MVFIHYISLWDGTYREFPRFRCTVEIVPVIASDNGLINFASLMTVEPCPAISLNGSHDVTENNEYIISMPCISIKTLAQKEDLN